MLKRRRDFQARELYFHTFTSNLLANKLTKSMQRNYFQDPKHRVVHFKRNSQEFCPKYYFRAKTLKQCFLSFSYRVPRAKLGVSRFVLARGVDYLSFGPYKRR